MFWFYMGIACLALDPPPLCQTGKLGRKKVPQTILASPYTPRQTWEKSAPNQPGKTLHPLRSLRAYGNNTFLKGASLRSTAKLILLLSSLSWLRIEHK